MKIGAQLYTVHDYTKTLEGFSDALARVADMGYTSVQVSGTCAYEPEWLAAELKKNGLTCDLTHTGFDAIAADPAKAVANHDVFGCKYIGIGGFPGFYEKGIAVLDDFMNRVPAVTKAIAQMGKKFFYHNHAHEFKVENGTYIFEQLVKNFSPEELGFTLDVYWVAEGGHDPVQWLRDLKGRVQCIHFKDMATDSEGKHIFSYVGGGILDFDKIIQASYDADVEYAFVEQDNCYGADPFECLKKSYDFLKSKGLN